MADHQQQPQQVEMNVVFSNGRKLPTGFRFHPSDYEIINNYLTNKVVDESFTCDAIAEVDLNTTEPWDLPRLAKMGEKEWYFFYQKDRKYPTGLRANRATVAGYWKATGKDKEVYKPTKGEGVVLLVGMKKTLVFYKGRAPRGVKTNWVMHEYRLEGSVVLPSPASTSSSATNVTAIMNASAFTSKDEWVVCRVFDKTIRIKKTTASTNQMAMASAEINQNQNNISAIPIPMPLRLSLPMPMPMQFPILPDFCLDPVAPYYPNVVEGMPLMIPPMAGVGGTSGLQINSTLFGNLIVVPPQMNFYHQISMRAARQMDMGAAGAGGFDVAALEGRLSSMVSQKVEQANAAEISLMMPMASPGSVTTTIDMDGISKFKY